MFQSLVYLYKYFIVARNNDLAKRAFKLNIIKCDSNLCLLLQLKTFDQLMVDNVLDNYQIINIEMLILQTISEYDDV